MANNHLQTIYFQNTNNLLHHADIDEQSFHTDDDVIKFTPERSMSERLSHIRQKCIDYMKIPYWQNLQQSGRIWTYVPRQINYCITPKVGCTFWKRIMRFIAHDVPPKQNIQHPSDIDRLFVHYGALSNIRQTGVQSPIARMLMVNGESFMFSRDPYTRLWSAYIDKFLLPDFWRSDGPVFVNRLRPNATAYERKCANNVTFQEFLLFIKQTANGGLNEHWDRTHRLCSPCHAHYDVIGKLESFGPDSNYILTKYKLEYLIENTTKLDIVREEIKTLVKYNFDLESAIKQGCFEKLDVAKRLWLAFQYNGYIHRNTTFPERELLKTKFLKKPIDPFINLVFQTLEAQTQSGIGHKTQKVTMMKEAYKKIPRDLLEGIAKVYEYDFELFGYERNLFK